MSIRVCTYFVVGEDANNGQKDGEDLPRAKKSLRIQPFKNSFINGNGRVRALRVWDDKWGAGRLKDSGGN